VKAAREAAGPDVDIMVDAGWYGAAGENILPLALAQGMDAVGG